MVETPGRCCAICGRRTPAGRVSTCLKGHETYTTVLGLLAVWKPLAAIVLVLSGAVVASAQDAIPVIRAHSRVVTVTDGLHVKKDYWYVMPEKSPDTYYVEIPRRSHTVTFTTDVESISFQVEYGSRFQFLIRLHDGTDALTEVRAEYRTVSSYRRTSPAAVGDVATIPFTLGDNDKIYVKGRLNSGSVLDFQLDLGAGGNIITKSSVARADMTFDGTLTLRNSDGQNVVPSSSTNRLEIAGLIWDGLQFAVADNMTHREDGLVGNVLFRDKVIEIDYDRMVIAIHETRPMLSSDWTRDDITLDGGVVPFVRGTLSVGDSVRSGWFMLDTGAYTSILNSDQLSASGKIARELRRMLGPLGGTHHGPVLSVGGRTFSETNYSVRDFDGDPSALGLLGNDVLKRFNVIVDNREGFIYFKPNGHMHDPFRNRDRMLALVAVGAIVSIAVALAVWRARR